MIRTIMVLTFVALALLFVQPLLILWTLLTGDANFMYWTFIGALRIVLRLAGIRVRVDWRPQNKRLSLWRCSP